MTCFWDGIIQSLIKNNIIPNNNKNATHFVSYLKKHNIKTIDVSVNNIPLTDKQLQENYDSVNQLNLNNIRHGYLCSTFDPFLFLISQLFQVDIQHNYCGHNIYYKYNLPKNSKILYLGQIHNHKKILKISNNQSHLWSN